MTTRPKRIWRKRIFRATLCLLLGAVTTVGVAWGTAAGAPRGQLIGRAAIQRGLAMAGPTVIDVPVGEMPDPWKFFYPPSVTLEKGYDLVFMGTGDRENACDTTGDADRS